MDADSYRPVKFIDRLGGNNHIVLLYDDEKYADMVIARYLRNGLEKGESCVFFAAGEPEKIEKRLSAQGIDVALYKKKSQLRVFSIAQSDKDKRDVLATLKGIRENATKGMKPPFRFVGRTITDTETMGGMELGMMVERTGHQHFAEFDNSQMCYYDVSRIEQSRRDEWISRLLKNHHHVVYASDPDRAVAFETTLLEEGE
jgi:hypothetical protein